MQKETEPAGTGKECECSCEPRLKEAESKLLAVEKVIQFLKDKHGFNLSSSGPGVQESNVVADKVNGVKIEGVIDEEMQSETDSSSGQVVFDETQANSVQEKAVIDKETQMSSNEDECKVK